MARLTWHLAPGIYPFILGFIPEWLDDENPLPAQEQLDANYRHGGGWRPFNGFTLVRPSNDVRDWRLSYPGDPDYRLLAYAALREEIVLMFPHSWVAIVRDGQLSSVARLD